MSLSSKLAAFKKEQADTAARNITHARPVAAAAPRVSTPTPQADASKRSHDAAFAASSKPNTSSELFSLVSYARQYLRTKFPQVLPFSEIYRHLSVAVDQEKNKPYIERALETDNHVELVRKGTNGSKENGFKYKPTYPVTNAEELKDFLARQTTAAGIPVKDLKDGWPDCVPAINQLEQETSILVLRHKDNVPRFVWMDLPAYHIPIDQDFREFWLKTRLPATETEIRTELEKAGITPTSQVKEPKKLNMGKKERKRPNRRGGKTTNTHMLGILKDYSNRR